MKKFLLITGAIVLVFILVELFHGYGTSCPRCGKWWGKKEAKIYLGDEVKYENATKRDIVRDRNGKKIGSVDRKGLGLARYEVYKEVYFCKKCYYNWNKTLSVKK